MFIIVGLWKIHIALSVLFHKRPISYSTLLYKLHAPINTVKIYPIIVIHVVKTLILQVILIIINFSNKTMSSSTAFICMDRHEYYAITYVICKNYFIVSYLVNLHQSMTG